MSICLLCRHGSSLQSSLSIAIRHASSYRNYPYVLTRLAIDLDAADSKLVKRAEDIERHTPKLPIRLVRVQSDDTSDLRKKFPRRRLQHSSFRRFKLSTVTPPDVLAAALVGSSGRDEYTQQFILHNGLDINNNEESLIRQMAFMLEGDALRTLRRAGLAPNHKDAIAKEIAHCSKFSELQRALSMLSSTQEGCEFLAANGSSIVSAIATCRKAQVSPFNEAVSRTMVLGMLMALHRLMKSKGVEVGEQLCNISLYYASALGRLSAVKLFLELFMKNGYSPDGFHQKSVINLCRVAKYGNAKFGEVEAKNLRLEASRLITGWKDGTTQQNNEQRMISFARLVLRDEPSNQNSLYPAYIVGLGQLGLVDELWVEWLSNDGGQKPILQNSHGYAQIRAHMFATALLIADDPRRALIVLQSIEASDRLEPDKEGYSKGYQRAEFRSDASETGSPIGLDMMRVSKLHHYFYGLTRGRHIRSTLTHHLQNIPNDPQKALDTLQRVLINPSNPSIDQYCHHLNSSSFGPATRAQLKWDETGGNGHVVVQFATTEGPEKQV